MKGIVIIFGVCFVLVAVGIRKSEGFSPDLELKCMLFIEHGGSLLCYYLFIYSLL